MILIDIKGHLVSDTSLDELHGFAKAIGLKRHFYQGVRKGHPHYDCTTAKKIYIAMTQGALLVKTRQLLKRMVRS